jgi:hypothetical protein
MTARSSRDGISKRLQQILLCALIGSVCGIASAVAQDNEATAPPPAPADSAEQPVLHPHRAMRDRYLWATFGPPGLIGDALSSGFQQWRDVPHEWGQSPAGYAKRFAAEYAESAVGDTTKYLVARVFDEDPSFRPCTCVGIWRRVRHASMAPFSARKFNSGRTVFSIARLSGIATGNLVAATTWYPEPQGARGVAKHVAVDVAGKIGVDLLREFLLHRRGHR